MCLWPFVCSGRESVTGCGQFSCSNTDARVCECSVVNCIGFQVPSRKESWRTLNPWKRSYTGVGAFGIRAFQKETSETGFIVGIEF